VEVVVVVVVPLQLVAQVVVALALEILGRLLLEPLILVVAVEGLGLTLVAQQAALALSSLKYLTT
jgi:hypothetical protein